MKPLPGQSSRVRPRMLDLFCWIPAPGKRPAHELHEAIPPAYTEHIGGYLLAEINSRWEVAA